MALLTSELQRIRFELGYNNLSVGAEPYIGYVAMFDRVVAPYINSGAKTTSTTYVEAAPDAPALQAIVLTDATGFSAGDAIWLDVDARQERAVVEQISGSTVSVFLQKAHGILAGTLAYSVTVEGGEAIVREILANIRAVRSAMSVSGDNSAALIAGGGLKRVDEIEFYGQVKGAGATGGVAFQNLNDQLAYWRRELASALGVPNLWEYKRGVGGGRLTLY